MGVIFIIIGIFICTAILSYIGISASAKPPKTRKEIKTIKTGSIFICFIAVVLAILQGYCTHQQQTQADEEKRVSNQTISNLEKHVLNLEETTVKLNEENQKALKAFADDMDARSRLISSSPDFDLKKRAMLLSRNILEFSAERRANDPSRIFSSNDSREDFFEKVNRMTEYSNQTKSLFFNKFANDWESTVREMRSRGVKFDYFDQSAQSTAVNYLSMEHNAIQLGTLASQMK